VETKILKAFTTFDQYQLIAKYFFDKGIDTEAKFIDYVKAEPAVFTFILTNNVKNAIRDLERKFIKSNDIPNIFK
jgi:hypothetical protein